jgi:NhaA family Na+:H+ antiporter
MLEAQVKTRVDADVASSHASGVRYTPPSSSTAAVTWSWTTPRSPMPCSARSATARALRRWIRQPGAVHRRHPVAGHLVSRDGHQLEPGPPSMLSGTGFRPVVGRCTVPHVAAGWVNDALLTVFFLVVGLEIRRPPWATQPRGAVRPPIAAAVGGMTVPALICVAGAAGAAIGWVYPWPPTRRSRSH